MPLPTLQKLEIAQPQPATMRLQAMKMNEIQKRAGLAEQGLELEKQRTEATIKHQKAIEMIQAYDFAFKNASDQDEFNSTLKNFGYDTNVKFNGPEVKDVKVLGADGKTYMLDGRKQHIAEAIDAISKDPKYFTDPKTAQWLRNNGVTIRPVEAAGSETDKPMSNIGKLQSDLSRAKTPKERKEIQAKIDKEIKATIESGDGSDKKDATTLRKEFAKQSTTYVTVRDAHNRVEAAAKDPSAAGDLALIFNYMKVLDPGSVVREGEFANAENSGSIPQRIWGKYNKILRGERLAPEQRTDLVDRSRRLYKEQEKTQKQLEGQYKKLATSYEVKPEDVIVDYLPESELDIKDEMSLSHKPAKTVEELINKYPFLKE